MSQLRGASTIDPLISCSLEGVDMTDKADGGGEALAENPLITQLIKHGADEAITIRGFIGPTDRDGHIRLFPRIGNLGDSVEIARSDIIHAVKAPRSSLGAVIVWVKKDAKISVHRVNRREATGPEPNSMVELRKGRLRMRMKSAQAREQVCFSVCMDCLSWCDCSICSTLPE
jgi:hypothetical protein